MSASKLQPAAGKAILITWSCSVRGVNSFNGLDKSNLVEATIAAHHTIQSNEEQELKELE
jgi:hypothetical protein